MLAAPRLPLLTVGTATVWCLVVQARCFCRRRFSSSTFADVRERELGHLAAAEAACPPKMS